MRHERLLTHTIVWSFLAIAPVGARAQGTLDDYRRAATVNQRLAGLTIGGAENPVLIGSTRFWYRKSVKGGNEFVVVDAASGTKTAAFDHTRLATALSAASG